jgi:hypothetical protein
MKNKGDTADNKERRLHTLEKILEEYDIADKRPSPKEILQKLENKGFYISKTTLYDDYSELTINDSFVRDLAEKTYSKYIHDCFDSIEFAERKARKVLQESWSRSKISKKDVFVDGKRETIIEKTITESIAEPHLKAIAEIRECAVAKVHLLSGDIIKVSAKIWSIQRARDLQTIYNFKAEIQRLKSRS